MTDFGYTINMKFLAYETPWLQKLFFSIHFCRYSEHKPFSMRVKTYITAWSEAVTQRCLIK